MARAYLALAQAWGSSRFDEATALLQWTRSVLEGAAVASDSVVLDCVKQTPVVLLRSRVNEVHN
jgi:hypothetical protein